MTCRRVWAEKTGVLRPEVRVFTSNAPSEVCLWVLGKQPRTRIRYYCSSPFMTAAKFFGDGVEIISLRIPLGSVNDSRFSFVEDMHRYGKAELGSVVRVAEPRTPSLG